MIELNGALRIPPSKFYGQSSTFDDQPFKASNLAKDMAMVSSLAFSIIKIPKPLLVHESLNPYWLCVDKQTNDDSGYGDDEDSSGDSFAHNHGRGLEVTDTEGITASHCEGSQGASKKPIQGGPSDNDFRYLSELLSIQKWPHVVVLSATFMAALSDSDGDVPSRPTKRS
ncbi:hypothetical protein LXL04_015550 [Taraxacum kok-saghyz]